MYDRYFAEQEPPVSEAHGCSRLVENLQSRPNLEKLRDQAKAKVFFKEHVCRRKDHVLYHVHMRATFRFLS